MAKSSLSCGVCDLRHTNKPAIVWCTECDEGLCTECQEHHSLSKGTKNHRVILITEYLKLPSDVLKISQYCSKHNKQFQIYCRKHESPCCSKCTVESHNECRDIVDLHDVIQNTKASNALCEIEETFVEVAENLNKIRLYHKKNLSTFIDSRKEIENEITKIRLKINNHLDELQKDFIKQLYAVEEKEKSKICQLLSSLEKTQKEIADYQANIANIKHHATDLQMFLSLRQIEEDVYSKDKLLQSIAEGSEQHLLSYKMNSSIQNIMSEIKSFGEVHIETRPMDIVLTKKKAKQAQMMVPTIQLRSIESIKLKRHKTINLQSTNTRGCCILPDGRIAYTSFANCTISVCNIEGKNELTVKMPNTPYAIVFIIDDNALAVTSGYSPNKSITIIDMEKKQIRKTISLDSYNFGIALKENKMIYSAENKGIRMINPFDESISDIIREKLPSNCYIATLKENIYYTNIDRNTVTCYNLQGKIQWTFLNINVLKTPLGIDVDTDGNVYVVGYQSNNVVVISPDGQRHREVLTARDGLQSPSLLHYSRIMNQLLVANMHTKVLLFNLD
ncbi:uncharacterized protein LOC127705683 [Mytilus californianus]|uniref:uncharacterized protein LOC127705683 n=1 Tax=Mytilus californianus TaxID=6549 RepID=UPI0022477CEB|nr:uncharacterized protein LOC127705683 [Mytilus californianus]